MLTRRTLNRSLAALTAAALLPGSSRAEDAPRARNVVLVHGLFADGSCWSEVIPRLQAAGLTVTSVQNPLTTFDEALASTQRVLARQDGPTVLVGHSFSGMIDRPGTGVCVSARRFARGRWFASSPSFSRIRAGWPSSVPSAGCPGRWCRTGPVPACSFFVLARIDRGRGAPDTTRDEVRQR